MLFKRKQTITSIFEKHYNTLLLVVQKSELYGDGDGIPLEVATALFIMSDYAILSSQKDRSKSQELLTYIQSNVKDAQYDDYFNSRIDFYGEVIRGKELRGECLPGVQLQKGNPMFNIAIALADCIVNPELKYDYENAPVVIHSIFTVMNFSLTTLKVIIDEMVDTFKDVYDNA